jgi:uncharacterized protein (TIGR00369 family)
MTTPAVKPLPEGWIPFQRSSPFVNLLGGLSVKESGGLPLIGLRVEERHLNTRGLPHGGLLVTLADSAMGIVIPRAQVPPRPVLTVSLSVDFTSAARLGDWLEAHVRIESAGSRLAFASCRVEVEGRLVLRASGVFAFVRGQEADG